MKTPRSTFLLTAGAGALAAPLLAQARAAATDAPLVSYDSRLMGAPKFVDVDGIRTRYFDAGRGPTMVLIHGGQWPATASADGFAAIFDYLAASYHVYAFDKLGMGYTDAPKSAADYSMDARITQLPKTQTVARGFRAAKEQWIQTHPDRIQANPSLANDAGAVVWWLVDAKPRHSTSFAPVI